MTLLQDLNNAKAVFQLRAVCAALGIMGGAAIRKDVDAIIWTRSETTSPTNKESE